MNILLKRSSGYTKLDVVVRAHNTLDNIIDYAFLNQNDEIVWINGDTMGAGETREAKLILQDLKRINNEP